MEYTQEDCRNLEDFVETERHERNKLFEERMRREEKINSYLEMGILILGCLAVGVFITTLFNMYN